MTLTRKFKKKFGKKISQKEVNEVWDSWVEHNVINKLLRGGEVKIDSYSRIEIIGTSVWKDKRFVDRLIRGYSKFINPKRKDIKYSVVYKNYLAKKKIYFNACKALRSRVHETLCATNTYFKIQ